MGYDFSIVRGGVRLGHEERLCSENAHFATEIDLDCVLLQARLTKQVIKTV